MKRIILLIFFFTAVYILKAQTDSNRVWSIKGGITLKHDFKNDGLPRINAPQFYIQRKNNYGWVELGLNEIYFHDRKNIYNYRFTEFNSEFHLSNNILFLEKNKMNLFGVIGGNPYLTRYILSPPTSAQKNTKYTLLGVNAVTGLGSQITLSKNIKFEIKLYNEFLKLKYINSNDIVMVNQVNHNQLDIDFEVQNINLQMGVIFQL